MVKEKKKSEQFASLDLGSNTFLLWVGERVSETSSMKQTGWKTIHDLSRVVQVSKGLETNESFILTEKIELARKVLNEYISLIQNFDAENVCISSTAWARKALNTEKILNKENLGKFHTRVQILSGKEEALASFKGALSLGPKLETGLLIDIGGASTEIVQWSNFDHVDQVESLDIGAVKLYEEYFDQDYRGIQKRIMSSLNKSSLDLGRIQSSVENILLVSGTGLSFASLMAGSYFNVDLVGQCFSPGQFEKSFKWLAESTPKERIDSGFIQEGREEVIEAGGYILDTLIKEFRAKKLWGSPGGVRHGFIPE